MNIHQSYPLLLVALLACGSPEVHSDPPAAAQPTTEAETLDLPSPEAFAQAHPGFESYWYQGKAELTRFALQQHRYGEIHEGEAVLIFVTEPFLPDLQVKHESGEHESVSVLKLNAYRQFDTGIYPYTIMTSSFVPASFVPAEGGLELKVSTVVTEWCGNAYAQLNRRDDGVHATLHSYFQNEADRSEVIAGAPSEDGLWARMRRDPNAIEDGELDLIPALHWLRLTHRPIAPMPARVSVTHGDEHVLEVRYEAGRQLTVRFAKEFPYTVLGWVEREPDGGRSVAERTNAIMDDYWSHNGADDGAYRRALRR